jgi:alcohol dehydrogenase class IV
MEFIKRNNISNLKKILNKDLYTNILIVTGKNSFEKSGVKKIILNILKEKKFKVFYKKIKIPNLIELKKLIKLIKIFKPNLIISIGGGATLDLSKIANVMFNVKNLENKILLNNYRINKRFCDLIAIPTTAGSGAEVTTNAVVFIKKRKFSIENDLIKPNDSLIFPEFIISSTFKTKASSAFDALSQAIESSISVRSTQESIKFSIKSIKFFLENYSSYVKSNNLSNTYNMCLSAYYSGKAISISKTTAPHAVSYPFTSYFGVDHGHAVSLTLAEFLKFNYDNNDKSLTNFNLLKRYEILFGLFKVNDIDEFIHKLNQIKKFFKLENNLIKINKHIPNKINLILSNVNEQRLTNNPVRITKQIIKSILEQKIKATK